MLNSEKPMKSKKIENVAIVFGKEEKNSFNRYTFPILGRPVAIYPILAANYAEKIDSIYLSSDSISLINLARNFQNVNILQREISQPTLTDEVRKATDLVIKDLDYVPKTISILIANSPCVNSEYLDRAITFLENNKFYDSVATAMKRPEFNPNRIMILNSDKRLERNFPNESFKEELYFLDRRIMVIRTDVIMSSTIEEDDFEGLLGRNIHPIIQQEGIWDIDYIWQVPIVERWLKQNGFNDSETPYDNKKKKQISNQFYNEKEASIKSKDNGIFKVLITTVPFGDLNNTPVQLLNKQKNINYQLNPIGRKLKESELVELVRDVDIIIAGTEQITRRVMENGNKLKLISRVGIGLDSVDLKAAKELGIQVSYTPDAPSAAVAELTIAQMLNLLRRIPLVDRKLRAGIWQRIQGERLSNAKIGIIGTGRVGRRVLKHLQGFNPKLIMVNDINPDNSLYEMYHAKLVDKNTIYSECDIITLHVPLTPLTFNLIKKEEIEVMKKNVCLINTSRGGIINEKDLYIAITQNRILAAAIDVFENEPYSGNLIELDNCFLTCHIGSMTNDCRTAMELLATEEAIRLVQGLELKNIVPEEEYNNQIVK
ncbi:MAG: hypothetical protein C0412_19065 [Flavobacterium sp.]|nr:hypothetical protein [Flavobacterium sp.]